MVGYLYPRALPPVTHGSALQAPECWWGTCDVITFQAPECILGSGDVIIWAVLHKVKTLQRRRGRECGMVDRAHALS